MLTTAPAEEIDPFDFAETDGEGHPLSVRVLVRCPKQDVRLRIPIEKKNKTAPKNLLKTLKEHHPEYSGISFKQIKSDDIKDELLTVEMRLMVKGYKFGVLYARPNQHTENEFFNNHEEGPEFKEFLEWIGTKITLKGWEGYNAGLDTERTTRPFSSLLFPFPFLIF